ncbi:MAG TPA: phosphoglycerate mutase family protein [Vicinamibacteria bacterium]|nr:phosphoglycerate mutase family protein [Vicinamibacteria bacterium]
MSTRRHMLLLSLALLLPGSLSAQDVPTTVILVRHAEKAATPANDPGLTQDGVKRALALAHVAGSTNAAAIYVSQFRRTKHTVKPLAAALGLTPIEHPAADTAGLAHAIRASWTGKTVVVCGPSNSVPQVITALTGIAMADIPDTEFDNLYVVTLPSHATAGVTHLKYGKKTP